MAGKAASEIDAVCLFRCCFACERRRGKDRPLLQQGQFQAQAGLRRQAENAAQADAGFDQAFEQGRTAEGKAGRRFFESAWAKQEWKAVARLNDQLGDRKLAGADLLASSAEQAAGEQVCQQGGGLIGAGGQQVHPASGSERIAALGPEDRTDRHAGPAFGAG